jgi:hypothetical protein
LSTEKGFFGYCGETYLLVEHQTYPSVVEHVPTALIDTLQDSQQDHSIGTQQDHLNLSGASILFAHVAFALVVRHLGSDLTTFVSLTSISNVVYQVK